MADAPWQQLGNFSASLMNLDSVDDDSIEAVRKKEQMYSEAIRSGDYLDGRFWADSWCAAFVWKKTREFGYPVTEEVFRRIERNPHACESWMRHEIERLASQYCFFHWHLAFPDVFQVPSAGHHPTNQQTGWIGGFDVVLGNPPWERIQPEAIKFFALSHPELLELKREDRNSAITELEHSDPHIFRQWQDRRREDLASTRLIKGCGRYPLAAKGNINSYAIFQELSLQLQSRISSSGLVLQSGIATDASNIDLFRYLIDSGRLVSLFDFENREQIFPAVDSRTKFCLVTSRGVGNTTGSGARLAFYLLRPEDILQPGRTFNLSAEDLRLIAPNTGLCPTFRSTKDASLVFKIYRSAPAWISTAAQPTGAADWDAKIKRIFSMGYDSGTFRSAQELNLDAADAERVNTGADWVPVYEAKLFHQFDHRFATYENSGPSAGPPACRDRFPNERSPEELSAPRLWARRVEVQRRLATVGWGWRYLIGFRDIARATDERTTIASMLPFSAPDDTIRLVFTKASPEEHAALIANLNSFLLDFAARNVVASTHVSEYVANQFPVLRREAYQQQWALISGSLLQFIGARVLELVYTASDLRTFALHLGCQEPPFPWDENRRFQVRCELDALYFRLYGLSREDAFYILDTFPIVRRKDEAEHGEYRTKRVILEIYDAMAEAERTGVPYQTRLDPPPADPRVAHQSIAEVTEQ